MIKETASRLAIRVLDDVTQRLRREAESQDNLIRAAELNRFASVLEELRNEEESLMQQGSEKPTDAFVSKTREATAQRKGPALPPSSEWSS